MSQTTIRVDTAQRDSLARVAAERKTTLDEALRSLIFEHECMVWRQNLTAEEAADYDAEALEWAELDVDVIE